MRQRPVARALEAQLASLESRVQPHFLFNTLNSIASLIPSDPRGAERMTTQLASLLRSSLDAANGALVPLADELRTVRDYLDIERVRFGSRMKPELTIDAAAENALVPRFSLQTLVENSVKYAIAPRRDGGRIAVRASARDGVRTYRGGGRWTGVRSVGGARQSRARAAEAAPCVHLRRPRRLADPQRTGPNHES